MKHSIRLPLAILALVLGACQSVPQNQGEPASVSEVVGRIKADLGVYQAYDAIASAAPPLANECHGIIGFSIDSVKVSLTTQTDDTVSSSASATLPVGSATFGPSFSISEQTKGTQNLTFALYPKATPTPGNRQPTPAAIDAARYPIAASLQRLRDGLLEASQKGPCVSLIPPPGSDGKPAKDDGGTFAFGFIVIKQSTAGATLKLVVFSLGATNTMQRQAGNTITVSFKARPGSAAAIY